jgi:hypothetical protein
MRRFRRCSYWCLLSAGWIAAVLLGMGWLVAYSGRAGTPAQAPDVWMPSVDSAQATPVLWLTVHPRCPCSRATLAELARLMAVCDGEVRANVLMVRPAGAEEGWERTDLWSSAAAIPGVRVFTDANAEQSRRFGSATSGQVLLYAADGRLLFAGGITPARGHEGDSAGRRAVVALVRGEVSGSRTDPLIAPVYGCPLFTSAAPPDEGGASCCN